MFRSSTNALLVLTAFAPVLFTYAFVAYRQRAPLETVVSVAGAAVLLALICWLVLSIAKSKLPTFAPFRAVSMKPADGELLTYVIAYLLPLVNVGATNIDWWVLGFVMAFLVGIAWATHAYHFNPLLAVFGYHFYEVASDDGVTYVMLSDRDLVSVSQLTCVRQLGPYVLMDASGSKESI